MINSYWIESQDINFIEDKLSSRDEVDRSLELYEIVSQEEGVPRGSIENEEKIPQAPTNFKSNLSPSESTLLVN